MSYMSNIAFSDTLCPHNGLSLSDGDSAKLLKGDLLPLPLWSGRTGKCNQFRPSHNIIVCISQDLGSIQDSMLVFLLLMDYVGSPEKKKC